MMGIFSSWTKGFVNTASVLQEVVLQLQLATQTEQLLMGILSDICLSPQSLPGTVGMNMILSHHPLDICTEA